jgi:hypothetical protein
VKQRAAVVFKYTVYSLLILNVWLLLRAEAQDILPYKALDQLGWLLILGVFEWETRAPARTGGRPNLLGWPIGLELLGYGFALFALFNYSRDGLWVDVGNGLVWLAISAMIWLDILRPVAAAARAHRRRSRVKLLLYAATFLCAVLWGLAGAALDFYDAILWILCFFAIEMNLLRIDPPVRRVAAR